jgi:hypothetical protein
MPTTNGNRKILDPKRWEFMTPAPSASVTGSFITSSRHYRQQQLYVNGTTTAWLYNPNEDGWVQVPSPALAGTLAAGAAGTSVAFSSGSSTGSTLTASGGTTSTILTNQTFTRDLRGYYINIISGPNAGSTLEIRSNTIGSNSVITVDTQVSAFTNTNVYRLVTPVWYVVGSGTLAAGSFRKYDFATNTWTTLSQTNLPASIGTDGKLIATPSWVDTNYVSFATGTTTSGGINTLTNSTKNWSTDQWRNYQIRITTGTGAGQIRSISSNTTTVITVSTNWATQPDSTSNYSIEGNDDFLYYMGNNAVTLYRYSISTNTWTTLSPSVARAAAPGLGMSGHWVWNTSPSDWTNENAILNGRRIYSFRGNAGAVLDYYDIPGNTWVNALSYAPATETFTTGTKWVYSNNFIYGQKDATGRWFRYNITTGDQDGWNTFLYPNSTAIAGDTAFDVVYEDGTTEIVYIYMLLNTSTVLLRQMVI